MKAKEGVELRPVEFDDYVGADRYWSKAALESKIEDAIKDEWIDRWNSNNFCKETRHLFEAPDKTRTKRLIGMGTLELKRTIEALTGHVHLNKHLTKMEVKDDPTCELCKTETYEALQTPWHLFIDCVRTWEKYMELEGVIGDMTQFWSYVRFFQLEKLKNIWKWEFDEQLRDMQGENVEDGNQNFHDDQDPDGEPNDREELDQGAPEPPEPPEPLESPEPPEPPEPPDPPDPTSGLITEASKVIGSEHARAETPSNHLERGTVIEGGGLGVYTQSSTVEVHDGGDHLSPTFQTPWLRPKVW